MSERTTVHLMRHGEVDNPQGVLYGRLPGYHLSELGRQMAQLSAESLADSDVSHLVSSPLERAQETMAPVQAEFDLPVVIDDRVIEAANQFEGRTVGAEPKAFAHPKNWYKLRNPLRPSWGEPYQQIAARMQAAVADARAAARGHEAVIVSHQLPIWTVRLAYEGKRFAHDPRKRQCGLASITSLHFEGDDYLGFSYAEPAAALVRPANGKFVGGA